MRPGALVRTLVGQRVVHVGIRTDAGGERDALAGCARIAGTVPPSVVVPRDRGGHLQRGVVGLLEELGADLGVRPHRDDLVRVERSRLQQDQFVDGDLADVVKARRMFDPEAVLGVDAELGREQACEPADAEAMFAGLVVEELGGQRPVLRDVVGGGAHRHLQRIDAQRGQVAVDRGQLVVLPDHVDRRAERRTRNARIAEVGDSGRRRVVAEPRAGTPERIVAARRRRVARDAHRHAAIAHLPVELGVLEAGRVRRSLLRRAGSRPGVVQHEFLRVADAGLCGLRHRARHRVETGSDLFGARVTMVRRGCLAGQRSLVHVDQRAEHVVVTEVGLLARVIELDQALSRATLAALVAARPVAQGRRDVEEDRDARVADVRRALPRGLDQHFGRLVVIVREQVHRAEILERRLVERVGQRVVLEHRRADDEVAQRRRLVADAMRAEETMRRIAERHQAAARRFQTERERLVADLDGVLVEAHLLEQHRGVGQGQALELGLAELAREYETVLEQPARVLETRAVRIGDAERGRRETFEVLQPACARELLRRDAGGQAVVRAPDPVRIEADLGQQPDAAVDALGPLDLQQDRGQPIDRGPILVVGPVDRIGDRRFERLQAIGCRGRIDAIQLGDDVGNVSRQQVV